jgi:NTE family protein
MARTNNSARPRIGLALSGGAARGIAHVGVLRALEEKQNSD